MVTPIKRKKPQQKLSAVSRKHFGILFDRFKYFADGITLPTKSSRIPNQMRLLTTTFILFLCFIGTKRFCVTSFRDQCAH